MTADHFREVVSSSGMMPEEQPAAGPHYAVGPKIPWPKHEDGTAFSTKEAMALFVPAELVKDLEEPIT